jgi:hypothetical protein
MMTMNEKITELTTFLSALAQVQGNGYKCHGEISEVIRELRNLTGISFKEGTADEYLNKIHEFCGDHYDTKKAAVNEQIRNAYLTGINSTLFFERCSGVSTSLKALAEIYDDIIYVENSKYGNLPQTLGKVIFVENSVELPRGIRPRCTIRIRQIELMQSYVDQVSGRPFDSARIY